jgi:hypothetical protein
VGSVVIIGSRLGTTIIVKNVDIPIVSTRDPRTGGLRTVTSIIALRSDPLVLSTTK